MVTPNLEGFHSLASNVLNLNKKNKYFFFILSCLAFPLFTQDNVFIVQLKLMNLILSSVCGQGCLVKASPFEPEVLKRYFILMVVGIK